MKYIKTLFAPAVFSFLLLACSQESEVVDEGFNHTAPVYQTANNQIPSESFDNSEDGIYFGVIASGIDMSRGKIWINVGNDNRYNAYVEMVGGKVIQFQLQGEAREEAGTTSTYKFTNSGGSFILNLSDFNAPIITNALFNNTSYFTNLVKSRSHNRAAAVTTTFQEIDNIEFGGTWNLISDGSITDPNGINGEAVTSLMITMGTQVFIDNSFDNYDASYCLGVQDFVPTLSANSVTDTVMCDYQTTFMAGGIVKWSLGYDPLEEDYIDWRWCEIISSGTFRWTNQAGTFIREGWIVMD
jgi:hypothetical protein